MCMDEMFNEQPLAEGFSHARVGGVGNERDVEYLLGSG